MSMAYLSETNFKKIPLKVTFFIKTFPLKVTFFAKTFPSKVIFCSLRSFILNNLAIFANKYDLPWI